MPVLGGLQEAVSQLAGELKAQGHEVNVIANRYPRRLKRHEIIDDISVTRMHFPGVYLKSLKLPRIAKYIAGLLIAPVNYLRLLMLLRGQRPNVVNIHFLGSQAPFAMLASKMLGIRCVVSLHGDDVEGLPFRSKIDLWLFRKVLSGADYVTACSEYLLNAAKKLTPEIEGKSTAIHNGIRPEEFNDILPYHHAKPYIFAGGRFVRTKGFDVLLKAYSIAAEKGLQADLILAGDGPEKERLISLAEDLKLQVVLRNSTPQPFNSKPLDPQHSEVIFWGNAERVEMKRLMKGSELVVVPSRKESFGIVALEALAAGKKVVAARTGGLPEILENAGTARLVRPEDPGGLAEGIRLTLQNKTESIVNDLKEKSWETVSKRYLDIFIRINT